MKRLKQWLACRRLERITAANRNNRSAHSIAASKAWATRKGKNNEKGTVFTA